MHVADRLRGRGGVADADHRAGLHRPRAPTTTLTGEDLPVDAWRDAENRFHSSKAYFTVDLKRLRGTRIFSAHAYTGKTAVNDCTKPRSVELWQPPPVPTAR